MSRPKSISTSMVLALLGASLWSAGCGLKLRDVEPRTTKTSAACRGFRQSFPSSATWSSELLTTLLACSGKRESDDSTLPVAGDTLQVTAKWLNESFDSASRERIVTFLESVPGELGPTLQEFAAATHPAAQRHWPEWIRWTQVIIQKQNKIRPELLAEQLVLLAQAPPETIDALVTFLDKIRQTDAKSRIEILERLAKVYRDFLSEQSLQDFFMKGIRPLGCLRLEADRKDTSLISSGWSLLVSTRTDPIMFGRTFAQSYGLLQNFCQTSEIPTSTETYAALAYFVRNHAAVFSPILEVTDQSTRALLPLLRLWSTSSITFDGNEFVWLVDALNQLLTAAHGAERAAFASYLRVLTKWSKERDRAQILNDMQLFSQIKWSAFAVPRRVLDEWSSGSQKHKISFLETLGEYVAKDAHQKMAELLRAIKIRTPSVKPPAADSPLSAPRIASIARRVRAFSERNLAVPLPAAAKFLECLKSRSTYDLWTCLQRHGESIPYSHVLMHQEKLDPLFFNLRNAEQPGRWLGQGFFSAGALARWTVGMNRLRGLNLPIEHFVLNFPFADLVDDEKIGATYDWLKSAPQTQPESAILRTELGIPGRLSGKDFDDPVWKNWFANPVMWVPVQKILSDPLKGPVIVRGLKKLSRQKIRVELFRSDTAGLHLTTPATIGMLSALDLLLWEAPYDWTRKWIIGQILEAKTAAELADVLLSSRAKLETAFWALDANPLSRHQRLWKKTRNALTILDATITLRIEKELFNWSEVMKALAGVLAPDDAKDFLVSLQKTGIISSISHLLHERDPTSTRFGNTLIEVFHMIRSSKADHYSWNSAVLDNQTSHGLFVYQILALCERALDSPDKYFHLKQLNSLVKTGAYWMSQEKHLLPFKTAFDTISGPDTVFNPWIWVFLREIQDPRSTAHRPWLRVLKSLETSPARDDIRRWLETGIPKNIGSWMDAIILTPSTRF